LRKRKKDEKQQQAEKSADKKKRKTVAKAGCKIHRADLPQIERAIGRDPTNAMHNEAIAAGRDMTEEKVSILGKLKEIGMQNTTRQGNPMPDMLAGRPQVRGLGSELATRLFGSGTPIQQNMIIGKMREELSQAEEINEVDDIESMSIGELEARKNKNNLQIAKLGKENSTLEEMIEKKLTEKGDAELAALEANLAEQMKKVLPLGAHFSPQIPCSICNEEDISSTKGQRIA
jgi:hypothetical protein